MIIGIGCDLIEIERIEKAIHRSGKPFLERIFTDLERDHSRRFQNPFPYFSVRFAAKEALSKALGTGIGAQLSWKDMEILNTPQGKPFVQWNSSILERHGIRATHISLSHSTTMAMAYALLEG